MTLQRIDGTWPDDLVEAVGLSMVNASRSVGDYPPLTRLAVLQASDCAAYKREARAALDAIEAWKGK